MIKNLFSWPLIVFFILLTLSLSSYYGAYQLTTSITYNNEHLKIINIADDISSFVKRAEGHLFLYLILGDTKDRDIFFSRIDSLKFNLSKLRENNLFNTDAHLASANRMLRLGMDLINLKKETSQNSVNFSFESNKQKIILFHNLSSEIRSAGVNLAKETTANLKNKTETNLENAKLIYISLLFSGTILLFLIVLFIKKRTDDLEKSLKLAYELDKISNTDDLTKIGNRRSFNSAFVTEWQRAIRNEEPIALMIIDIDYFKLYNDTYGHIEGDRCLTTVAQALQSCMKRPADSIWRYGGEEFAILLPDTDNAHALAESCRKTIERLQMPHKSSMVSSVVTISIGVCICTPDQKTNSISFIFNADKALYRAKESGRNRVCTNNDKDCPIVVNISTTKIDTH